jgi:translation initiation factor IF-2
VKGTGVIAGCSVQEGIIKRDAEVRVIRDNAVVYTGRVISLKRFKEDANEVRQGFECGVGISNFNDVKVGDLIECFKMEKTAALDVNVADRGRPAKQGSADASA